MQKLMQKQSLQQLLQQLNLLKQLQQLQELVTNASLFGTKNKIFKEFQANVPITTINITPTKAAIGIISIYEDVYKIKINKNIAAAIPAIRVLPPDLTLIID